MEEFTGNLSTDGFNADEYLDSIIEEMGMKDKDPDKIAELKNGMLKQMNDVILKTVSLNIEPEVIDAVTSEYDDVEDPVFLLSLLVEYSPMVQIEVVRELEKFRERTLYAFNRLKKSV